MITSPSRVSVLVEARDPILKAGVVSHLRTCPEVRLLSEIDDFPVEVTVVVVDAIDDLALQILKRLQRTTSSRTVLIAGRLDDQVVAAAEAAWSASSGARGHADRLVSTSSPRAGEGTVPPDLLGRLLDQVGGCSAGCSGRGESRSPGSPPGRSRCCGSSPRAGTPRDRREARLLGADREERAPRRDDPAAAAQPFARRGLRDARGTDLRRDAASVSIRIDCPRCPIGPGCPHGCPGTAADRRRARHRGGATLNG